MNSTGVAIATSPCQPHHPHCLHVPGTLFLSPSLAPPQGTSGASAISHKPTCIPTNQPGFGSLPAPLVLPLLPSAIPAHHSESWSEPPGFLQGSFLTLPPLPQETGAPSPASSEGSAKAGALAKMCCPVPTYCSNCPGHGSNSTSNVCALKTTLKISEMLTAEGGQGRAVPFLHLPGHGHFCQGWRPHKPGMLWVSAGGQGVIAMTTPRRRKGPQKGGQEDFAFLAKQGQQTWGSPGNRGHFLTTCQGTALPWTLPQKCTQNAHENAGDTLETLMGLWSLCLVPESLE